MPVKPYIPRHSAYAVHLSVDDDGPIRAPGLAAAWRRNPDKVRKSAMSLLATGVLLFGITESASSAFGEGNPLPNLPIAAAGDVPTWTGGIEATDQNFRHYAGSGVTQILTAEPVHAKTKAPATKAVVSGLAANGIPNVALNAYRVAAARVNHASPDCGIDWALLAGIGRVESDHGRFAGAVLNADGTSTPRIMGPALDGVLWDYIPAPANGLQLYGDGVYAHALGPMQFIPSTWAIYGADGNGDGKADVFNVNDAALGAARYLCAAGGNLRTAAGQTAAVLAYNHSDQYLAQVLALANAYRTGLPVTGIPVGNTDGMLPPLNSVGYVPPVNPAVPTAVGKVTHTAAKAVAKTTSKKKASGGTTARGGTTGTTTGSGGTTGGSTGGSTTTGGSGTGTSSDTGGTVPIPLPAPVTSVPVPPAPVPSTSSTPPPPAPTTSTPPPPAPTTSTPPPPPPPAPTCNALQRLLHLC